MPKQYRALCYTPLCIDTHKAPRIYIIYRGVRHDYRANRPDKDKRDTRGVSQERRRERGTGETTRQRQDRLRQIPAHGVKQRNIFMNISSVHAMPVRPRRSVFTVLCCSESIALCNKDDCLLSGRCHQIGLLCLISLPWLGFVSLSPSFHARRRS